MSKIYEFLNDCSVFFLLTAENGIPYGRPFGAIFDFNGKLYFTTGTSKRVYHQIKSNPNIQIVALKNGTRNWIRIDGKATECNDLKIKSRILDESPVLKQRFNSAGCEFFAAFETEILKAELHTDTEILNLLQN